MLFEHSNYRSYLKTVFANAAAGRESNYSLRAFAERLGFANSYLSAVLSGKKPLSIDSALRIALKLNLSEQETQYFCLLVQQDQEKDPEYRTLLDERLRRLSNQRKTHDLSSDLFRIVSDWYHFAILELTYLSGFSLNAASAARAIGITRVEAEAAIERLIRLELLEKDAAGRLHKTKEHVLAKSNVPNAAIRKFHQQMLEKARAAIEATSTESRVNCTDILPVDSRDIDRVRQVTEAYTSEILGISERAQVKDQVYCLGVHFFKLTQTERKK